MRGSITNFPFLVCALVVVCVSPMAAYHGSLMDWAPGTGSFAFLAVPVFVAALTGCRTKTFGLMLLAIVTRVGESVLFGNPAHRDVTFGLFALLATFVMSGLTMWIVHQLRRRVSGLEHQTAKYLRDIYEQTRLDDKRLSESITELLPDNRSTADVETPAAQPEISTVDNALLLLTIQDISRRISTNLDLDTLIPVIINTAKTSLKCDDCQVYFWNGGLETLTNALQARKRDASQYVPSPDCGMAHWVMQQRQILTRKDAENDYSLQYLKEEDPHMPDAIAPLAVGGELLGLLVIDRVEDDSTTFVRLLYILANNYALGIKNAQLFKRIEEMARRDGLTGLLNHASFQEQLDKLCRHSEQQSEPLTVVMSDVDHFKKFNDTYGHQAGDHVLREVAQMFRAVLPDHALLARYGGEEFICALPGEDQKRGRELAEQLCTSLAERTLDFKGQQLKVTASFGVAECSQHATDAKELVRYADEALYQAKEAGRNQVVCSSSPDATIYETVNVADSDSAADM